MISRLMLSVLCIFMYATVANAAFVSTLAAVSNENAQAKNASNFKSFSDLNSFLSLSPKAYKELTGQKMSLKEKLSLKLTQKMLKKQTRKEEGGSLPQWAYIVLSILWLGWLAIGIKSNWKGNDWWISLLLYLLYFPGLIYSLIVMKKYY
jgi:uncharacterized membrane protein YqaE (UPF0057 family)